jgi:thiol:disulfide interchange protein
VTLLSNIHLSIRQRCVWSQAETVGLHTREQEGTLLHNTTTRKQNNVIEQDNSQAKQRYRARQLASKTTLQSKTTRKQNDVTEQDNSQAKHCYRARQLASKTSLQSKTTRKQNNVTEQDNSRAKQCVWLTSDCRPALFGGYGAVRLCEGLSHLGAIILHLAFALTIHSSSSSMV